MHDLMQRLSQIELDAALRGLLGFVESVDPCFFGLVAGVLVLLGSRMVAGQPSLQSWGLRLAAATFLIHGGYLWFSGKIDQSMPLWRHALRSAGVAGLVLACAWIVLPVLSFACRRLRLALAVFLGYGGYVAATTENFSTEHLPLASLQALAAAGLALVVAWIVDPFWTALTRNLFPVRPREPETITPIVLDPPAEPVMRSIRPTMLAPPTQMLAALEPPPPQLSESQRRRDRARMQLELSYLQALPVISSWLPRPMFDDFLRRHLGDHLSPEEVEENARQLLSVLAQHQEHVQRAEFSSLEELSDWLLAEQQRIQKLALEGPLKQTQLLDLHQRYLALATRMVQKQNTLAV